jgi:hypothetical protein
MVWDAGSGCSRSVHCLRQLAPTTTMTRSRQDASRQSLQPTCCQRAPLKSTNSRARGSHLADRLFGDWPLATTLMMTSEQRPPRGHRIARGHLRSRVMQQFGVAAPVMTWIALTRHAWWGAASFFLGRSQPLRRGLVPCSGRTMRPSTLPVAPPPANPLSRIQKLRCQEPFPSARTNVPRFGARSAFHQQVPSAPSLLALRTRLGGRH